MKKISFYIKEKFINLDLEGQLSELAELIGKVNDLNDKKSKLENERNQMTSTQDRVRENIRVLGKSSQESALKEKYVKKLTVQENRFEAIKAEIKDIDKQVKVLNKEIGEKMNKLKYN